jgi:S-methylmethionine-dependent homocysteine/selenocysteine methylase
MDDVRRPGRPLLLDGGLGRELRFRGVALSDTIWSATGLLAPPDAVRQIHADYIAAGADVITTNTSGLVRHDLADETDGLLPLRDDLGPEPYAEHASRWPALGATVVGGCCGTRPAHIARLRRLLDARPDAGR